MIEHLRKLGVTAIELLPIHAFIDDRYLVDRGLRNYWGYNTLSFFTPDGIYASRNALTEFRGAVQLHAGDEDATPPTPPKTRRRRSYNQSWTPPPPKPAPPPRPPSPAPALAALRQHHHHRREAMSTAGELDDHCAEQN